MIFEKAGSQIDPYVSSIALALSLLLGALFTTYLVCLINYIDRSIISNLKCKLNQMNLGGYIGSQNVECEQSARLGSRVVCSVVVSLSEFVW